MASFRYSRTPIPEEPGPERTQGFDEIQHPYSRDQAVLEAQRCLQCAMPYCVQACPIAQDARGYIGAIAAGDFDGAARLIVRDNPLATVLCKTCYHYCEDDCVMAGRGAPIAIRQLKRAGLEEGDGRLEYAPGAPRSERVAVVGGGPAGLSCAWDLALRGFPVTVFEAEPWLGGQMETIPRYHLDGTELDEDLARFRRLDITFREGVRLGEEVTPERLLADGYRAVYLALGASSPRTLGVPGEHLPGVFAALPLLLALNRGPAGLLGRKGRRVVVVGGGDVGMDAARSCRRVIEAAEVTVVYRRGAESMPAGQEELEEGTAEGIRFLYHRTPRRVAGTDRVTGLVVATTEDGPPDPTGRPTVRIVPGSEQEIPCDTVVVAAGEAADVAELPAALDLDVRSHPWAQGHGSELMTDVKGVFASGGRSVVHAMAAGERAAQAIAEYLASEAGSAPVPRPDALTGGRAPPIPNGYGGPTWHP